MFFRALVAFLLLPGIFAGIVPWLLSTSDPWQVSGWNIGFLVLLTGLLILLWCVRDFYVSGCGTLAPWSPPRHLVITGLYCYTRNPMYLGVLTMISGWGLINGSPLTLAYLVFAGTVFHFRVTLNEEKWLEENFKKDWEGYSTRVPRWIPDFISESRAVTMLSRFYRAL